MSVPLLPSWQWMPPFLHHPQMFYKLARVEYVPIGVVGAIVPWNYPFHNIFNPLTAALFAGNAIVVKASSGRWRQGGSRHAQQPLCLRQLLPVSRHPEGKGASRDVSPRCYQLAGGAATIQENWCAWPTLPRCLPWCLPGV
jgi:hypothetical protein